jgi:hypothetical protein
MLQELNNFIENLKRNQNLTNYDEASTKQAVILPILHLLGWNTHDVDEVKPEYQVEDGKVDYSLRLNESNEVFIEAKGARESLEKHEEQLLDYAFRQGVELASLTNGITWSIYLPTKKGDWKTRKFYTIDIIQQQSGDASQKFIDLLSKDNVQSGDALQNAESIYKGRLKKVKIEETLPQAWTKIVDDPDPLLVDLVAETTEKLCGFKPEIEDVKQFLEHHREQFVQTPKVTPLPSPPTSRALSRGRQTRKAGRVSLQELVNAGLVRDGQTLHFYHTRPFTQEQATIIASSSKLRYKVDGRTYSISKLAEILLKKHGFKHDRHGVAGPLYWKTCDGKLLNDLNEIIRAQRGDRK